MTSCITFVFSKEKKKVYFQEALYIFHIFILGSFLLEITFLLAVAVHDPYSMAIYPFLLVVQKFRLSKAWLTKNNGFPRDGGILVLFIGMISRDK